MWLPNWRPARSYQRAASPGYVPSADYQTFHNAGDAIKFLKDREDVPIVVKADGLAAGKGVMVCSGREEAVQAVEQIAGQKLFGTAGKARSIFCGPRER